MTVTSGYFNQIKMQILNLHKKYKIFGSRSARRQFSLVFLALSNCPPIFQNKGALNGKIQENRVRFCPRIIEIFK